MDVFTIVVIIVAIGTSAGIVDRYLKNQAKGEARLSDDVSAELVELKKRVAVLEEIVTDSKFQLDRELRSMQSD